MACWEIPFYSTEEWENHWSKLSKQGSPGHQTGKPCLSTRGYHWQPSLFPLLREILNTSCERKARAGLIFMVNIPRYDPNQKHAVEIPPLKLIWRQDHLVGGFNLPLWKMMEFFSWDDEIPNVSNILYGNIWKVIKFHGSSHHQSQSLWSKTVRVPKRNWTSSLRTVTATPLLQDPLALRTKGRSCNERLGISTETRKAEGTSMFRCLSGFWFVHKQWKRYELWDEQKI